MRIWTRCGSIAASIGWRCYPLRRAQSGESEDGAKCENYAWSSAAGHCGLRKDTLLTESSTWLKQYEGEGEWSAWLAETERPEQLDIL